MTLRTILETSHNKVNSGTLLICPVCGTVKKRWRAALRPLRGSYRCSSCTNHLVYRTRYPLLELFILATILVLLPFIFEQMVLILLKYNELAGLLYIMYILFAFIVAKMFHYWWTMRFLDETSIRLLPNDDQLPDRLDRDSPILKIYQSKHPLFRYSFEIFFGAIISIQLLIFLLVVLPSGQIKSMALNFIISSGIVLVLLVFSFIFLVVNAATMGKIQSAVRNGLLVGFVTWFLVLAGTGITLIHLIRVGMIFDSGSMGRSYPVLIKDQVPWKDATATLGTSVAIKKDGTIWQWGLDPGSAEKLINLGQRIDAEKITKMRKIDERNGWSDVEGGLGQFAALRSDGSLWTWGVNQSGQLGHGSTIDALKPEQVLPRMRFRSVSVGGYHMLAVSESGSLWAWGVNSRGGLGNGSMKFSTVPVPIANDQKWKTVDAGYFFSAAINEDGTLWAWGDNTLLQVGGGFPKNQTSPVRISSDDSWESLCVGSDYGCAVKKDGTLWTWGNDVFGQSLAEGTISRNSVPTLFKTNNVEINQAAGGNSELYVLDTDHRLWIAGDDYSVMSLLDPGKERIVRRFLEDPGFKKISHGFNNSFGIDSKDRLWAWGDNLGGKLGDYDTSSDSLAATAKALNNGLLKRIIENIVARGGEVDN